MNSWGTHNQLNAYKQDEMKARVKEHLREAEQEGKNKDYNEAGKTRRKSLFGKIADGIIIGALVLSVPILILLSRLL